MGRSVHATREKRSAGDAYCNLVYRTTHRAASQFLTEIAPKYPAASSSLLRAARDFAHEANCLDSARPLIGWQAAEEDADRNAELWPILARARDHYATAIGHIEKAIPLLA